MSETSVSFAAMGAAADAIRATFGQLQSHLEDLNSQLAPMVGSWNGAAKDAYHVQQTKWNNASNAMAQILNNLGTGVAVSNEGYQAAENNNLATWS
jgi:early secretory antigenic target protein ESAT-6